MTDLRAWDDIDEFGTEIDDPVEELMQDVYHTLLETFGSNPDVPTRGAGLNAALSGVFDENRRRRELEARLSQDDRIDRAQVTFTALGERGSYRIDLVLQVNGQALGLAFETDAAGNLRRLT